MKKQNKMKIFQLFLIFSFITIIIFSFPIIPFVKATPVDYIYQFEKNIAYNSTNSLTYTDYNIKNKSISNGNYNATYTFTNDINNEVPNDWINVSTGSGTKFRVLNQVDTHHKLVELYDYSSSYQAIGNYYFSIENESASLEYWIKTCSSNLDILTIQIRDTLGSQAIVLRYNAGNLEYRNLGGSWITITTYTVDTWYHYKLELECSTHLYKGLSADTFNLYINGVKYSNLQFRNAVNEIDYISFATGQSDTDMKYYLDAFGISFNGYSEWNNLYSQANYTNDLQIDKYEFNYDNNDGNLFDNYESNLNTWSDIDPTYNEVYSYYCGTTQNSIQYKILQNLLTSPTGFEKDNIGVVNGLLNISIKMDLLNMINIGSHFYFDIFSYDDTLNCRLYFDTISLTNYSVYYYDGSSYNYLFDIYPYRWNISYFNFYFDTFIWLQWKNPYNNISNNYFFDKIDVSKEGLNKIQIYGVMDDILSYQELDIDYIGIYNNSNSLSQEAFYNKVYHIDNDGCNEFDSNYNNLFKITALGQFSIVAFDNDKTKTIADFYNYTGVQKIYNTWIVPKWKLDDNPKISLISNFSTSFTFYNLFIEGVMLNDSIHTYSAYYTYGNNKIDKDTYYYYVQNNKMYYTLKDTNQTALEYIEASFELIDFESINRTLQFTHRKNTSALYSEFKLYYTDTSYFFVQSETTTRHVSTILEQAKVIDKLEYLITDNNITSNKTLSGYFNSLTFIYNPNLSITITTISFFGIIPILVLILIVPIIIVSRTKLKFLFLPLIMIFSIICYASGIIPIWLTVIINIFCLLYYFLKRKYSE